MKKHRAPAQKRLPQALSDPQCRQLLAAVEKPVHRVCFAAMYGCGLRISEALCLTPAHIDKDRRVIRLVGKGNKERLVPLPASVLDGLRDAWREHRNPEWIFAGRPEGGPLHRRTLYRAFRYARAAVDLPQATPHVLRHSYATRLLEKGVKVEVVQILLGHASPRTTQTYLHLTEPLRDQIHAVIGDIMSGLC